jgi:hypothetical protein
MLTDQKYSNFLFQQLSKLSKELSLKIYSDDIQI